MNVGRSNSFLGRKEMNVGRSNSWPVNSLLAGKKLQSQLLTTENISERIKLVRCSWLVAMGINALVRLAHQSECSYDLGHSIGVVTALGSVRLHLTV